MVWSFDDGQDHEKKEKKKKPESYDSKKDQGDKITKCKSLLDWILGPREKWFHFSGKIEKMKYRPELTVMYNAML